MNWLLIFGPAAVAFEFVRPAWHILIFTASSLAIVPLAGWMGRATEELADALGEGSGGLLNATFGNAAELIIALAALRAGLHDVVKASLAGSIIGNILLVLGGAMVAGGARRPDQRFNPEAARSQATMLILVAIALVLPAAFAAASATTRSQLSHLSVAIAGVLLTVYVLYLLYSLGTHSVLFAGHPTKKGKSGRSQLATLRSVGVLAASTAAIAWMSEILVGVIEPTADELGLSSVFVGVFVVAIVGNAAEHATALTAAIKDRMDLSLAIAIGSSIQIALFVAPMLVLASLFIGPATLDLAFPAGLVLSVVLAVFITSQIVSDGRSDWLEGALLLAVYVALGLTYFFIPVGSAR